jgi:hypothetical protein
MSRSSAFKRYCLQFFCTVFFLFSILLGYGFIFDPWQLFHQPWFRSQVFISNSRFQNAGLINSYDFDSVILGNSMAENFSAHEASQALGGTFINLSMAGSLFSERQIVLEHLFRRKKIRQLIISLDHTPNIRPGQYNQDLSPDKYAFLYNWNPLDDFRLYFDVKLFRCWNFMEKNSCWQEIPGAARVKSQEELYKWFPYYVNAFGGAAAWCGWSRQSPPFKIFLQEIIRVAAEIQQEKKDRWTDEFIAECRHNSVTSFEQHILPLIKAHPETKFFLFFPPYSRLWYAMQEQYYVGYYQSYVFFIEDMVKTVETFSNVKLFGFDNQSFTADIANYKDQSHYHKKINSKILYLMADKTGLLREANLEAYLQAIKELSDSYDLQGIAQTFQQCLKQQADKK